jgi:hypothetical protein
MLIVTKIKTNWFGVTYSNEAFILELLTVLKVITEKEILPFKLSVAV